ncbi:MAG: hypothetical protein HUU56_15595 [Bdellovibrionaceae bacterium]|nr:hypothetical protein [Pseudobdellovibrionaceae bacterium]
MTAISNKILILLFSLLLLGQLTLQVFDVEIYENTTEYRKKPKFPDFKMEWDYIKEFEDFYQNNFKLRNILIHANAMLRFRLFQISSSEKVIVGKNGWLFYEDDKTNNTYRNVAPYTSEQLEEKFKFHEKRAQELAKKGIPYVFFVGPNKQSIYPEFLPDWAQEKLSPISRYDQLMEKIKTSKYILSIDSKKLLLDLKTKQQLYYKTDSHWNIYAGYHIYHAVMKKLYEKTKNELYLPTSFETYKIQPTKDIFPGDLLRMMDLPGWIPETGNFDFVRPIFPEKKLRFTLFHDSFYISLRLFFEFQYDLKNEAHWVEEKNADWNKISNESDFVIYEQVERNL